MEAPVTYGGYSDSIVVNEQMVLRVPPNLKLAGAAPLLCAGVTTYSPRPRAGGGPGKKTGIVGLGGLVHIGTTFARTFEARVSGVPARATRVAVIGPRGYAAIDAS